MWEIWANLLLPKAFKRCPKSNKLPDLVTLLLLPRRYKTGQSYLTIGQRKRKALTKNITHRQTDKYIYEGHMKPWSCGYIRILMTESL